MTPRRVLYVDLAPAAGGSSVSLYQLASHLDPARYTPTVVLSRQNPFDRFDGAGIPLTRVRTPQWEARPAGVVGQVQAGDVGRRLRGSRLAGAWHSAGDLRRYWRDVRPAVAPLAAAIERCQPDLVHLNDNLPLCRPAAIAAWRARRPAICHCRSFDPPAPLDNWLLAPRLAGLIFISQAVAEVEGSRLATRAPRRVIANAVDLAEFDAPVDVAALRAGLGVPAGARLVGALGRITPWKGQHLFVEAVAQLAGEWPDLHALVVGGPEGAEGQAYLDALRRQATEAGLDGRLHFVGQRDDAPAVMAALDVLVHSAVRPEPFGRVIVEGMAARRAVVASAAGGAAEIVESGRNGLLTPPGDVQALVSALQRLLADPAERARLGEAGRRTVEQRYTVAAHVLAVQAFYDGVLAGRA